MNMALIKVKVGDKVYELDRLTLGDGATLKRRFGVTDLNKFDGSDPETLLGLMTLAIAKTDGLSLADAEKIASDLDVAAISEADPEPTEDPTSAADDAAAPVAPEQPSSSETPLSEPGIQP